MSNVSYVLYFVVCLPIIWWQAFSRVVSRPNIGIVGRSIYIYIFLSTSEISIRMAFLDPFIYQYVLNACLVSFHHDTVDALRLMSLIYIFLSIWFCGIILVERRIPNRSDFYVTVSADPIYFLNRVIIHSVRNGEKARIWLYCFHP